MFCISVGLVFAQVATGIKCDKQTCPQKGEWPSEADDSEHSKVFFDVGELEEGTLMQMATTPHPAALRLEAQIFDLRSELRRLSNIVMKHMKDGTVHATLPHVVAADARHKDVDQSMSTMATTTLPDVQRYATRFSALGVDANVAAGEKSDDSTTAGARKREVGLAVVGGSADGGTVVEHAANGTEVGAKNPGLRSIAIGTGAGDENQDSYAVAIGYNAARTNQSWNGVAVGREAGNEKQGRNAIAIGAHAAQKNQSQDTVAVGYRAGEEDQGRDAIAIGRYAAQKNQSKNGVAVGREAGDENQGVDAIAIGRRAAQKNQSEDGVAIGWRAGEQNQGPDAIAIGSKAGTFNQSDSAIAIGHYAAEHGQGKYAINIRTRRRQGCTDGAQGAHGIIISTNAVCNSEAERMPGHITIESSGTFLKFSPVSQAWTASPKLSEYAVDFTPLENKLPHVCWFRMPTGCAKTLAETDIPGDWANHWFVDRASFKQSYCEGAVRRHEFDTYCERGDAESRWAVFHPNS